MLSPRDMLDDQLSLSGLELHAQDPDEGEETALPVDDVTVAWPETV
jgi:hypothetical protein